MNVTKITNDTRGKPVLGDDGVTVIDPNIPKEMQRVLLEDESMEALSATTTIVDRNAKKSTLINVKKVCGSEDANKADSGFSVSTPSSTEPTE